MLEWYRDVPIQPKPAKLRRTAPGRWRLECQGDVYLIRKWENGTFALYPMAAADREPIACYGQLAKCIDVVTGR